jgi:hypothetical protein
VRDEVPLLPTVRVINKQLTRNRREVRRLRTLLRLAIDVDDERRQASYKPHAEAPGREVRYES